MVNGSASDQSNSGRRRLSTAKGRDGGASLSNTDSQSYVLMCSTDQDGRDYMSLYDDYRMAARGWPSGVRRYLELDSLPEAKVMQYEEANQQTCQPHT